MKLAVIKERAKGEARVAASPETVKKLTQLGFSVAVESGAGAASSISDEALRVAGAEIAPSFREAMAGAEIVLAVQAPRGEVLDAVAKGAVLIAHINPLVEKDYVADLAARGIEAYAMELMPRISRAQSMDVLSSQANLAGYRAVIDAVARFTKAIPMMMTAAGTIAPAKVLVLGAGVAGLQAIATAKRLGAVVSAFDVRSAAKEQVESLGAKFVEVPAEEAGDATGGYAREMSAEYKQKQSALIAETLAKTDIAITTALIPGKPAPVLITEDMVRGMKAGSIIVDLAVTAGGNCPLSRADEEVDVNGVTILSYTNVPSRVAIDASQLYAKNLYHFLAAFTKEGKPAFDEADDLVKGTLITKNGAVVHPQLTGQGG